MDRPWFVPLETAMVSHATACGLTIRRLREERKISAAEVARFIGKSRAYVSEVERGVIMPSMDSARRIARALRQDPEECALSWSGAVLVLEQIASNAPRAALRLLHDRNGKVA
jgi:transcriptional regulator with XRE-family HTH domain